MAYQGKKFYGSVTHMVFDFGAAMLSLEPKNCCGSETPNAPRVSEAKSKVLYRTLEVNCSGMISYA
jgi:hypothetical protein